ncbi:MAG: hypothetical protein U5L10_00990 [Candidatus Moranbacteria bacterium]|nr:hypothetical protein [Candidatus Moranbacteria bacterium]
MKKSMFSDWQFESLREVFQQNNPRLAGDRLGCERQIKKFDDEINKLLEEKEEGFEGGVNILLQGRNLIARHIGAEEVEMPEFSLPSTEKSFYESAIGDKHVAVFVPGRKEGEFFALAIDKALSLFDRHIQFVCYTDVKCLIDQILASEICGVVAFHLERRGDVEAYIRHEIKNLPGWNSSKAEKYFLPPCKDYFPVHPLGKILQEMISMQSGFFQEGEQFELDKAMKSLVSHMYIPQNDPIVLLVDDRQNEVDGLIRILKAWPAIGLEIIIGSICNVDQVALPEKEFDILLLDEGIGQISGTELVEDFFNQKPNFPGIICSISGGDKPGFTQYHFQSKLQVKKGFEQALGFVKFMNGVLRRFDRSVQRNRSVY